MKVSQGSTNEPRSKKGQRFGRANWLLKAVFVMVLAQFLMSLPIGKRLSSFLSGSSSKQLSASHTQRPIGPPKPWGELECERVVLEVPDELISDKLLSQNEREWYFPLDLRQQFQAQLGALDLTGEQRAHFQEATRWRPSTNGYYFSPDPQLVLVLNARARQQIYSLLSSYPQNVYQYNPFTFHVETLEERFADCDLSKETLAVVKSLLYQRGQSLCFSDMNVFDDLPLREHRRLLKTLSRIPVVFMRLRLTRESNVDALLNYWGKQGNAKCVRPLLERLVKVPGGTTIDIAHLLPPFARKRLFTFPFPSPTREWERQDCFWTTMNFFADQPDDRMANLDFTFNAIKKDYFEVQGDPNFGDMVALINADGKVKHCCIYVADDVVFTKNGGHFLQPWALMKIPDVVAKYPSEPPVRMVILRSNKS